MVYFGYAKPKICEATMRESTLDKKNLKKYIFFLSPELFSYSLQPPLTLRPIPSLPSQNPSS